MTSENRQRPVAFLLTAGLGTMLAALAGYLVYIHVASSESLAARAFKQHHMIVPIQPTRGNILDARLRVLAGSQQRQSVFVDPKMVDDPVKVAMAVAPVLGLDREEVFRSLADGQDRRYVWLRRGVSAEKAEEVRRLGLGGISVRSNGGAWDVQADAKEVRNASLVAGTLSPVLNLDGGEVVRQLVEAAGPRFVWLKRRVSQETADAVRQLGLAGVGLTPEGVRTYPNGSLAAHVIGFVGVDEQGLEGLERMFEERLRGQPGEARVLADRFRRPIWMEPDDYVPAHDGHHLVLTIDARIQAAAEEALAETVRQFRAVSGSAIVMDPHTGAILALANVPTYEPGRYSRFPMDARRNRALTDTFPPGSSAKPFFAAAAAEAGVVRFGEVIYCEDGYWAAARLHDAGHAYGNLTFEQGVIKSSNIMMGKLGMRLGNERLYQTLGAFGFGRRTDVWLPGEAPGLVYPLSRWTKLSTTRVPFGQEFAVTPLQMITAFAAIANDGKLLKPKILRGVLDNCGQVAVDLSEPEVVGRPLHPSMARKIIDRALVGVVEEGTGKKCQIPGYRVFGKTGTAQKIDPETRLISHSRYLASFMGGAPAQDPRVVAIVVVNEPDKALGYYGGTVAAPAVKTILETTLAYLGVPPTETVPEGRGTHLVRQDVTD